MAVYVPAQIVNRMADPQWLAPRWNELSRQLMVDKVYLETYCGRVSVEEETMRRVKRFFEERRIGTAGGITYTSRGGDHFHTLCYSRSDDRRLVREQAERTARLFDEVILDDFTFTN